MKNYAYFITVFIFLFQSCVEEDAANSLPEKDIKKVVNIQKFNPKIVKECASYDSLVRFLEENKEALLAENPIEVITFTNNRQRITSYEKSNSYTLFYLNHKVELNNIPIHLHKKAVDAAKPLQAISFLDFNTGYTFTVDTNGMIRISLDYKLVPYKGKQINISAYMLVHDKREECVICKDTFIHNKYRYYIEGQEYIDND